MKYEEKKDLVDAAIMLREYCKSDDGRCEECIFFDSSGCAIYETPRFWNVPIITQWTPKDVALAKVLKALGAKKIARSAETMYVLTNEDAYVLDIDAFQHLTTHESISLNTIIKEVEEK